MKLVTPKFVAILILSFVLFSCSNNNEDEIFLKESAETIIEDITYSSIEIEILDLVNAHRNSINLPSLTPLNIVSSVAESHTNYMIETGEVSHDNFATRSDKLINTTNAISIGENVAYGYGSAQGVVNGWLNSIGHREVIENADYTHFGISTEQNNQGRNYFTQIFIKK